MPLSVAYGVNESLFRITANTASKLALIAGTGAKWVRADAPWGPNGSWGGIESTPGTGSFQPAAAATINALKASCIALGMNLIVPVDQGAGGGNIGALTPAQLAAAMAWIAGQCPGITWEILNEPDFNGTTGTTYAAICQAVYPAMKAADPTCTVVAGAIAVPQTTTFITAAYAAGIKGFYDVMSIHTYDSLAGYGTAFPLGGSFDPAHHLAFNVSTHQAVMAANTDAAPLWITECGWDSFTADAGSVTLAQQAEFLARWLSETQTIGVPVVISYNLVDASPSPNWGLVDSSLNPKLAYFAVRDVVSKRVLTGSANGRLPR